MTFEVDLISLVASSSFIMVNKSLIQKLGLIEANVFAELANEYSYWKKVNKLTDEGYFFSTLENMSERLNTPIYSCRKVVNDLINRKLVYTKTQGMPRKRYFKINHEMLYDLLKDSRISTKNDPKTDSIDLNSSPIEYKENDSQLVVDSNSTLVVDSNSALVLNSNPYNNNIINKNKKLDLKYTNSENSDVENRPATLSDLTKSDHEDVPSTKNKLQKLVRERERRGEPAPSLGELIGEKLSDIDGRIAREKKLKEQERRKNEPTQEEKICLKIKKNRMNEAKEIIQNESVLSALEDFIEYYQFTHNKLSKQSWKLILDDLLKISSDPDILVKSIKHSIASSYRKIYPVGSKKASFDNTAGREVGKALHEFTEEEKLEFESTLARNEDGTFMEF